MATSNSQARSSWICRDDFERARFMDLHARMLPVNSRVFILIMVVVAICAPSFDEPLALAPSAAALGLFGAIQRHARRFARPELAVFWALLASETLMLVAFLVLGVERTPAMALVLWPAIGLAGRFRLTVTRVGTAYVVVATAVALVAPEPSVLSSEPLGVLGMLAAIIAATTVSAALRESDLESREAAILDPLTGMLNRHALVNRTSELEHQSRLTGQPVAVIVADIDHFKSVNDAHGHPVGDQVLAAVAEVLRRGLRAYDLAYRMGGEEFAIVMPGIDAEAAHEAAERLRLAFHEAPCAGVPVTVSFGVAASLPGQPFQWEPVFGHADAALYHAKRNGRDRVAAAAIPV